MKGHQYIWRLITVLRKFCLIILIICAGTAVVAQKGMLTGNLLDDKKKGLEGATVILQSMKDSTNKRNTTSTKTGEFSFQQVDSGYFRLKISYVGMQELVIDSIHFREERADFNLSDITLKPRNSETLGEVIIYAEKPLIQSKDGNITFNAAESSLSAGSTAGELLTNVPLVTKDPNGKITVRGKEPKILIDDKPVELNMQQLQDLLESMPGSSIEKIEVMTNPPPQYANEQGGVINITTKKGKVGRSGRLNISGGTRGEAAISGNFSYRKQGLSISINAGLGYSQVRGEGYSSRNNIYSDSSNYFKTASDYKNKNLRPNFRFNLDYDISKVQSINFVLQYNQNDFSNLNHTTYTNVNRFDSIWKLSTRSVTSEGNSYNPGMNFSYTLKGKTPGEQLRIIQSVNLSLSNTDRDFFQQYFNPDHTPNGSDSTQQQLTDNESNSFSTRVNYEKPLANKKTYFSFGTYFTRNNSHLLVDASYLRKSDGVMVPSTNLSNHFRFHQNVLNYRASVKQIIQENFSITAGGSAEQTAVSFELYRDQKTAKNKYWTFLPFANINRNWKEIINLTIAYRRSIRRPGINELNPAIDYGDPYNIRFGNTELQASTAHNFDLVLGRTKPLYYINLGLGYNIVEDVFSQVRTLLPDGKTQVTWENISGRHEYELSTWGGMTVNKKWKANISSSYNYNVYSQFDKTVNRYRNGGSLTSNFNTTWSPKDTRNITASFTFNRIASPQGFARWNWSMNLGVQQKFFNKKLTITANLIDPVRQQTKNLTYGTSFVLNSFSTNYTQNFRLSVGYNFTKTAKPVKLPAKK